MIEQILIMLPLILGAYITLSLLKLPDFSLESAYLCGAVLPFFMIGMPLPILLLVSLIGGLIVGTVVFIIIEFLQIPFLLAAVITNGLFHGFTHYMLGTSFVSFHPMFALSDIALFSCVSITFVGIMALCFRSELSYSFAIYGNNPLIFRHLSVSERYVKYISLIMGHGSAALSGFLFACANGFIDLSMNMGIILLSLTSLILGKIFIKTVKPHLLVPLVGLILFFCIQKILLNVGLNLKYFNAFQALVVLAALSRRKSITLKNLGV